MDLAEVLADEDARWAEIHELIGRLTPSSSPCPATTARAGRRRTCSPTWGRGSQRPA